MQDSSSLVSHPIQAASMNMKLSMPITLSTRPGRSASNWSFFGPA